MASFTVSSSGAVGDMTASVSYNNVADTFERVMVDGVLKIFVTPARQETSASFSVSFTPASGAGTEIVFCDKDMTNDAALVLVPKSGAGTRSQIVGSVTLHCGHEYAIKMRSRTLGVNTFGVFTIHGLDSVT